MLIFLFHNAPISHFQYVDDTILFIENYEQSIENIKKILLLFQVINRLSINFNKSQVYHVSSDSAAKKRGLENLDEV